MGTRVVADRTAVDEDEPEESYLPVAAGERRANAPFDVEGRAGAPFDVERETAIARAA